MRNEVEWIEWLRKRLPGRSRHFAVGIGDDAAVLRLLPGHDPVVTTDLLVEDVHFLDKIHPPKAIGFKAVMRGASDLAAMAAKPVAVFLSVALRRNTRQAWVREFLAGVRQACRRVGVAVGGGDTSVGGECFLVDTVVLGEVRRSKAVLRSHAQPGDEIFVSGRLGQAALGLELLRSGVAAHDRRFRELLRAHLYPEARCRLALELARLGLPSAMIDLSDGLSTDLHHLCRASRVGAIVEASAIPVPRLPPRRAIRRLDTLQAALHGGEDYELLFTVPVDRRVRVPHKLSGVPLTRIGHVTSRRGICLVDEDGRRKPLPPLGWDHFRRRKR
jgi:thiamine-monophosphate kinase